MRRTGPTLPYPLALRMLGALGLLDSVLVQLPLYQCPVHAVEGQQLAWAFRALRSKLESCQDNHHLFVYDHARQN